MIFDCDGVLVDSERLTVEVESRVLTEMGWHLSVDEVVQRFVGRSSDYMLGLQAIDGVERLIRGLHQAGVATCIASSGSYRKMELTLGVTNLDRFFEGRIYSASEVLNGKPAPDLFLHAASRMGVDPETCAVIEDSVHGVTAAVSAGMACYGFAGGLTRADVLVDAGAVAFHTMDELSRRLQVGSDSSADPS